MDIILTLMWWIHIQVLHLMQVMRWFILRNWRWVEQLPFNQHNDFHEQWSLNLQLYSVAFTHRHGTIMSPLTLHYLNSFDTLGHQCCLYNRSGTIPWNHQPAYWQYFWFIGCDEWRLFFTLDSEQLKRFFPMIISYADCNNFSRHPVFQIRWTGYNFKTTGSVSADYLQLSDILATGGTTFTANNSIDAEIMGWTINSASPRTLYWIGGSGNWNDQTNWSLSSGGAGGECTPTAIDDVVFWQCFSNIRWYYYCEYYECIRSFLDIYKCRINVSMERK